MSSLREQTKRARGDISDLDARLFGRDKVPHSDVKLTRKQSDTGSKCDVVKPTPRTASASKVAVSAPMSKSEGKKPMSYKCGGKVSKTGNALVHKNEVVLPVNLVKQLQRLMK